MAIDIRAFYTLNVTDTCSIWNILSSNLLFSVAIENKCNFSCTGFVLYECLYKPRSSSNQSEKELKNRLIEKRSNGYFKEYHIAIDDLQEISLLETRQKLSKGELSSIIFAKQTNQALMTEDQKARRLAEGVLEISKIQTTPHLLGWLIYTGKINDTDKDLIAKEHVSFGRPLDKYFQEVYRQALEFRLAYKDE